jgi:hypothetical protein
MDKETLNATFPTFKKEYELNRNCIGQQITVHGEIVDNPTFSTRDFNLPKGDTIRIVFRWDNQEKDIDGYYLRHDTS